MGLVSSIGAHYTKIQRCPDVKKRLTSPRVLVIPPFAVGRGFLDPPQRPLPYGEPPSWRLTWTTGILPVAPGSTLKRYGTSGTWTVQHHSFRKDKHILCLSFSAKLGSWASAFSPYGFCSTLGDSCWSLAPSSVTALSDLASVACGESFSVAEVVSPAFSSIAAGLAFS